MAKLKNIELFKSILRRLSVESLAVLIALFSALILVLLYSYRFKLIVDFYPLNGAFQTFNPIQRLLEGEIPGKDFNPYLGVGITYLTGFLTRLLGGSFSASQFVIHGIHLICHFANLFILAYLCELSVRRSLLLASAITVTTTALLVTWLFAGILLFNSFFRFLEIPWVSETPLSSFDYAWRELVTPSGSNLGLRSSLPFLVSALLLVGLSALKGRERWIPAGLGTIAGILPFWSNDYGISSGLMLLLFAAIYILRQQLQSRIWNLGLLIVASFMFFALVGSIATYGHLINWIKENFINVTGDQFWYFNTARYKAFNLEDILPEAYLYVYGAILLGFFGCMIFSRNFNQRYWLLAYIGLTTFSSGIISTVGGGSGKPFLRYYFPAIFVSYFLLPKCIAIVSRFVLATLQKDRRFPRLTLLDQLFSHNNRFLQKAIAFLMILYCVALLSYSLNYPLFETPSSPRYFYSPETGGWLSSSFTPSVYQARLLRERLQYIPPQRRILSTYSTIIDMIVGSRNSSRIDYIIHALGETVRQQYLREFRVNPPEYITTLREEFTAWETWVRRVDWWFYREFMSFYEPVDATFYNVTWQRRSQPKTVDYPAAQCRLERKSDNAVYLLISTQEPTSKNPDFVKGTSHFVDITLNYFLKVNNSGVPFLGSRGVVNISELKTASLKYIGVDDNRQYGLPHHHLDWHIPVEHRLGKTSVLALVGYPQERSRVEVLECQAQLVAPVRSFEVTKQRFAKNLTDKSWKNGILTVRLEQNPNLRSEAAFVIADPSMDYVLNSGGEVEFAEGGKRKIVDVSGEQVFVTGEPLDPIKDGYPNPITFTLR